MPAYHFKKCNFSFTRKYKNASNVDVKIFCATLKDESDSYSLKSRLIVSWINCFDFLSDAFIASRANAMIDFQRNANVAPQAHLEVFPRVNEVLSRSNEEFFSQSNTIAV